MIGREAVMGTVATALQLCRGLSSDDGLLHDCPPLGESNCEIRAEPTLLGAKLAIRRTIRVVTTSKAPRRAQSAIRAQEDLPPAHEISCASDDAHSASRAADGESLAQSARRAV